MSSNIKAKGTILKPLLVEKLTFFKVKKDKFWQNVNSVFLEAQGSATVTEFNLTAEAEG